MKKNYKYLCIFFCKSLRDSTVDDKLRRGLSPVIDKLLLNVNPLDYLIYESEIEL